MTKLTNTVYVWFKDTSEPVLIENAVNIYQKGDFLCVYAGENVDWIPLANIWRVRKPYAME